jgi:hypothetical protein
MVQGMFGSWFDLTESRLWPIHQSSVGFIEFIEFIEFVEFVEVVEVVGYCVWWSAF